MSRKEYIVTAEARASVLLVLVLLVRVNSLGEAGKASTMSGIFIGRRVMVDIRPKAEYGYTRPIPAGF